MANQKGFPQLKLDLPLISRQLDKIHVDQRVLDGYINATSICKASSKKIGHYLENKQTKEFLAALSSDIGIPISELIQSIKGGKPQYQGTWVHPQVAINLAQWASPKFAVLVSKWVFEWMGGNVPGGNNLPYHIKRYLINRNEIPYDHFSVFNEVVFSLIAPLEDLGYNLPDKFVPDISQGRIFARWVREEKGLEPNDFPTYTHTYPDGRVIEGVKLYPNTLLADFKEHFNKVWLVERAAKYFKERDATALPYLQDVVLKLKGPSVKAISTHNSSLKKALDHKPPTQIPALDYNTLSEVVDEELKKK